MKRKHHCEGASAACARPGRRQRACASRTRRLLLSFNVPPKGTAMDPPLGDFDLMLQLRTVAGSARL
jgi:hypothetical protein